MTTTPTTAATHVSIVAITSTIARLLLGTVTDLLAPAAPSPGNQSLANSISSLPPRPQTPHNLPYTLPALHWCPPVPWICHPCLGRDSRPWRTVLDRLLHSRFRLWGFVLTYASCHHCNLGSRELRNELGHCSNGPCARSDDLGRRVQCCISVGS